ncbi:hypothetical protein B0H12DRAFT_1117401 [Mycena haematopus]|nr:hypothetical protein B0H12DRAFT_1117401 [Mycena haematopus]
MLFGVVGRRGEPSGREPGLHSVFLCLCATRTALISLLVFQILYLTSSSLDLLGHPWY